MNKTIIYEKKERNERIDHYLVNHLNFSRNSIDKMIDKNLIKLNGKDLRKHGIILKNNDKIEIIEEIQTTFKIIPLNKKIDIIFETKKFMIINKKAGTITHPSSYEENDSLSSQIRYHWIQTNNNNFLETDIRQGICHRLDKETSGLIIVAKDIESQKFLMNLIKENKIKREYIAILEGKLKANEVIVDCPIKRSKNNGTKMEVSRDFNAKNSKTTFKLVHFENGLSLVRCVLETGRTHQIRVHSRFIDAPVLNDNLYGRKTESKNQFLMADRIFFIDPFTNDVVDVKIEMPKIFKDQFKENFEND